jgi:hypothetical protein
MSGLTIAAAGHNFFSSGVIHNPKAARHLWSEHLSTAVESDVEIEKMPAQRGVRVV